MSTYSDGSRNARSQLESLIGKPISDVETPALLLDLDRYASNARQIHQDLSAAGVAWRPHVKTHANPALARSLIEIGAIGVTCATVEDAIVLAQGGIKSILVANEVASAGKANAIACAQRIAEVIVCIDDEFHCQVLGEAATSAHVAIPVLLEVDIGMGRAGRLPGPGLARLAGEVVRTEGLELRGVMGYEGHLLEVTPPEVKLGACRQAVGALARAAHDLRAAGFPSEIVSCGGTGSYRFSANVDGITEIQAGGGCLMDRWYVERCGVDWLEPALFVATTVVSRPNSDRVIVDAGFKAMSMHDGVPVPVDESAGTLIALFAEHGVLHLARPSLAPKIGERISFIPGYSDSTTVLHSVIIGTRNDRVEAVFPRPPRSPLVSPFPGCSRDRDSARPAAIVDPPGGTIK